MIAEIAHQMVREGADQFASMGPRSNDRGNTLGSLSRTPILMLQWGRDQMIAEIRKRHDFYALGRSFNGAAIK